MSLNSVDDGRSLERNSAYSSTNEEFSSIAFAANSAVIKFSRRAVDIKSMNSVTDSTDDGAPRFSHISTALMCLETLGANDRLKRRKCNMTLAKILALSSERLISSRCETALLMMSVSRKLVLTMRVAISIILIVSSVVFAISSDGMGLLRIAFMAAIKCCLFEDFTREDNSVSINVIV
jgi:hypothetical protein